MVQPPTRWWKQFLFKARDIYNEKRPSITRTIQILQAIAFFLTLLVTVLGVVKIARSKISWELLLDIGKVILEGSVTLYFFLFGIIRLLGPRMYDPMRKFYKTLNEFKSFGHKVKSTQDSRYTITPLRGLDDVTVITCLAEEAWGKEKYYSYSRKALYKKWYQANQDIFSLILDYNNVIGYLSIIPLLNDGHFESEFNKYNIGKDIIGQYSNSAEYVFVESIYLRASHQDNKYLISLVYNELLRKTKLLAIDGYARLYFFAYYKSLRNYLKNQGFGSPDKKKTGPGIRYLPFFKHKELENEHTRYKDDYKKNKCDIAKSGFFLNGLSNTDIKIEKNIKPKIEEIMDSLDPISAFDQFFDNSFCDIEEESTITERFLGKTFCFYTHAIYRTEDRKLREHSLGLSYIRFDRKKQNKFISCKFYTGTKVKKKAYIYNGICFFSKDKRDILMIFHPEWSVDNNLEAVRRKGNLGDAPAIITGRILGEGASIYRQSITDDRGEVLLSLNLTTYSQHSGNTLSKIGVLHMDDKEKILPNPESLFTKIEIDENDDPVIKTIKLYLMRSTKVIIKAIDKDVINSKKDIDDWMKKSYNALVDTVNINYELYYYKNKDSSGQTVGTAYVTFLENGIAKLRRSYTNENKEEIIEQYFGEVNIRHNEDGNRFLYIKFIEMDRLTALDKSQSLYQHYRELFVILFWPEGSSKFDFTRGIILGDKDVEDRHVLTIINSTVCVLCNPNKDWNKKFNLNKIDDPDKQDLPFDSNKIKKVDTLFLKEVLKGKGLNFDVSELKKEFNSDFKDKKIFSSIEIHFDKQKMCDYKHYFKG